MKFPLAEMAFEECLVVIAGHETNFLAIDLVGDLQADAPGDLADFGFFHAAERGEGVLELILAEAEKEIRLVLARIAAFFKHRMVGVVLDDRVMPGGDEVGSEGLGLRAEFAEFQMLVAHHAGIRSPAEAVFAGEIVDDDFFEVIGFVHDIVGDAEFVGDPARIRDGGGTAAFVLGARDAVLRPHFHRHADDLPSVALKQRRRDAGIHAAAHSE